MAVFTKASWLMECRNWLVQRGDGLSGSCSSNLESAYVFKASSSRSEEALFTGALGVGARLGFGPCVRIGQFAQSRGFREAALAQQPWKSFKRSLPCGRAMFHACVNSKPVKVCH